MNVCEHGDHPAPEGRRFCSAACQRCESEGGDGCTGICTAPPPELLTVEEAAPILRTTPKAVRHMLDRGALPAAVVLRLGRRVLLRRDALRAHLGLLPSPEPRSFPTESR